MAIYLFDKIMDFYFCLITVFTSKRNKLTFGMLFRADAARDNLTIISAINQMKYFYTY